MIPPNTKAPNSFMKLLKKKENMDWSPSKLNGTRKILEETFSNET